jgi:hypothetical protein
MGYGQQKSIVPEQPHMTGEQRTSLRNKRREERIAVAGNVHLELDQDGAIAVDGRLIDLSGSGFRALHDCMALVPGKVVRFEYSLADKARLAGPKSGWARVIWTRTESAEMESGFYVVLSD